MAGLRNVGVRAGLASALLFGAGTPAAKLLLGDVSPWLLAGLLYLGSGVGLGLYRVIRRAPRVRVSRTELLPLAGAVFFGGMAGPVLLMFGLSGMPASGASLLLNAEGVATALLAKWPQAVAAFVKVMPRDYKRVLRSMVTPAAAEPKAQVVNG